MYIVYDPATGSINGTISGPGKEYGADILDKNNQSWIFLEGAMNVDPRNSYVDIATKQVQPNAPILLVADKMQFIANGADEAMITGIPLGATMRIFCNGEPHGNTQIMHDTSIELASDQVAEWRIDIYCARFISTSITLQSIEPPPVLQKAGTSMSIPDYSKGE